MSNAFSNAWLWLFDLFVLTSLRRSLLPTLTRLREKFRRWMRIGGWRIKNKRCSPRCPSLITIVGSHGSRVVQFSHFSVEEFLKSVRLATSNEDITFSPTLRTRPLPRHPLEFYFVWTIASTPGALLSLSMLPNTGFLTCKSGAHRHALCVR